MVRAVKRFETLYGIGQTDARGLGNRVAARAKDVSAQIQVNQVGYEIGQSGRAYLMVRGKADGSKFSVLDAQGTASFSARSERRQELGANGMCTLSTSRLRKKCADALPGGENSSLLLERSATEGSCLR